MKKADIQWLKETFETAHGVLRHEWDFGEFKAQNEIEEKRAAALFDQLLEEATE